MRKASKDVSLGEVERPVFAVAEPSRRLHDLVQDRLEAFGPSHGA